MKSLTIIMDFVENTNYGVSMKQFENRTYRTWYFLRKLFPSKIFPSMSRILKIGIGGSEMRAEFSCT